MLGAEFDIRPWERRASEIPWLSRIARECRGVHPPRYSSLFEACSHAIVFQQISIHAAGAIMRRVVESIGDEVAHDGVRYFAFPTTEQVLSADDDVLRVAVLSLNKRLHLRSIAEAIQGGTLLEADIAALPTPEAALRLASCAESDHGAQR